VPVRDVARFAELLRDDILPLLEEYCYEDFEALERIVGSSLIHRQSQRVNTELFDAARHGDLIQGLLSAFEDITATREAAATDDEQDDDLESEDASE
jgi:5-methylcytosine-specific restriction protein B